MRLLIRSCIVEPLVVTAESVDPAVVGGLTVSALEYEDIGEFRSDEDVLVEVDDDDPLLRRVQVEVTADGGEGVRW